MPNGLTDFFNRAQQNVAGFFSKDPEQPSAQSGNASGASGALGQGLSVNDAPNAMGITASSAGQNRSQPLSLPQHTGMSVSLPGQGGRGAEAASLAQSGGMVGRSTTSEKEPSGVSYNSSSPLARQSKVLESPNNAMVKAPESPQYSLTPEQIHRNPAALRSMEAVTGLGYWNPRNFFDPFGH